MINIFTFVSKLIYLIRDHLVESIALSMQTPTIVET